MQGGSPLIARCVDYDNQKQQSLQYLDDLKVRSCVLVCAFTEQSGSVMGAGHFVGTVKRNVEIHQQNNHSP